MVFAIILAVYFGCDIFILIFCVVYVVKLQN